MPPPSPDKAPFFQAIIEEAQASRLGKAKLELLI
jgi:hypothetical protein